MIEHSIIVENLGKSYGDFRALDGVSFKIKPGEIVGFLGPNGAGKTTTMKILTCFMAPSEGKASVGGYDVYADSIEVRKRIGYLPESVPLYDEMMVYDYLNFIAEIRGIPTKKRHDAIAKVVELTGLKHMISRDIGELSKGYRQRVGLAQAIIHEPEVVILDEPTSGLDPNQIVEIRDLIKEIGKEKTVVFSTHILQEVAAVCDRIILIVEGKIIADDSVEGLENRIKKRHGGLVIETYSDPKVFLRSMSSIDRIVNLDTKNTYRIETNNVDETRNFIYEHHAKEIIGLYEYRPSLEDIFRTLTNLSDLDNPDLESSHLEKSSVEKLGVKKLAQEKQVPEREKQEEEE